MGRFVQGEDRRQDYLLPASLDAPAPTFKTA